MHNNLNLRGSLEQEGVTVPVKSIVDLIYVREHIDDQRQSAFSSVDPEKFPSITLGFLADGNGALVLVDGRHRRGSVAARGYEVIVANIRRYLSLEDMLHDAVRLNAGGSKPLSESDIVLVAAGMFAKGTERKEIVDTLVSATQLGRAYLSRLCENARVSDLRRRRGLVLNEIRRPNGETNIEVLCRTHQVPLDFVREALGSSRRDKKTADDSGGMVANALRSAAAQRSSALKKLSALTKKILKAIVDGSVSEEDALRLVTEVCKNQKIVLDKADDLAKRVRAKCGLGSVDGAPVV